MYDILKQLCSKMDEPLLNSISFLLPHAIQCGVHHLHDIFPLSSVAVRSMPWCIVEQELKFRTFLKIGAFHSIYIRLKPSAVPYIVLCIGPLEVKNSTDR